MSVLADRLAVLGETPPVSPDLSLFSSTYQALLQFHYDIMLSDMITAREWTLAFDNNPDPTRPLSLSDQYAVKALALERSAMIRMGMKGMSEKRSRALIVLLQALLQTRV